MLLAKKEILNYIKKGLLVQNLLDAEKQVQQAGVDLTVAKIFSLTGKGVIDFSNEKRQLPDYKEIPMMDGIWKLKPGLYNATMNEIIKLPKDVAALVFPRSSALVCGLEAHTALWDPGYEGRGFLHFTLQRPIEIHQNARIVQMIFLKTEETEGYNGNYQKEDILKNRKRGFDLSSALVD